MKELLTVLVPIPDSLPFSDLEPLLPQVSLTRQKRIAKLKREADRKACLLTGLLMRGCIARELSLPPQAIPFTYGPHGKPLLADRQDYWFSVSNAREAVCFVSAGEPIGIDLEPIREQPMLSSIAEQFFSQAEWEWVSDGGAERFYQIWTAKEAYLKRTGQGLSVPLDSFSVLDCEDAAVRFFRVPFPGISLTICCGTSYSAAALRVLPVEQLLSYIGRF